MCNDAGKHSDMGFDDDLPELNLKHDYIFWEVTNDVTDNVFSIRYGFGKVLRFINPDKLIVWFCSIGRVGGKAELSYSYFRGKKELFFIKPKGNVVHQYLKVIRQVKYLIHFTLLENLTGIMKDGICPRVCSDNSFRTTDQLRLDGYLDASSFSVSFPNYRMLYEKKKNIIRSRFAVLLIDIDVLLGIEKENVAFYSHNAGSGEMAAREFSSRTLIDSAADMFKDNTDKVRERFKLPSYYTTDPQAEILIRDVVPPIWIKEMHVRNDDDQQAVFNMGIYEPIARIDNTFFSPRVDYEYWSSK